MKQTGLSLLTGLLLFLLSGCSEPIRNEQGVTTLIPEENPLRSAPVRPGPPHAVSPQSRHKDYFLGGSFSTGDGSYVRSLFADDEVVWVGTTEGIIKVDRKSGEALQTFTTHDGLKSPYIFTINKDPQGVLWFGTNNGGLSRYDGSAWKTYLPSDGLADFWVYGMDFSADGAMWIATWDGVSVFDGQHFTNYNTKDGLADKWVYAIVIDDAGSVWFGTERGVSRLDKKGIWKTWTHQDGLGAPNKFNLPKSDNTGFGTLSKSDSEDYSHKHNLSILGPDGNETYNENYVFSSAIDHDGNLWFGTWGGGASRFDGTHWLNYTTEEGLAGNIVFDITVDPHDGAIWFGTNHGASRFDGKSWTSLTLQNGLTDENVYAIAIDKDQKIWFGEKGGVDVWAPIKKEKGHKG